MTSRVTSECSFPPAHQSSSILSGAVALHHHTCITPWDKGIGRGTKVSKLFQQGGKGDPTCVGDLAAVEAFVGLGDALNDERGGGAGVVVVELSHNVNILGCPLEPLVRERRLAL